MIHDFPSRRVARSIAPVAEPVSLAEAKTFLRIDSDDEDTIISEMITAARMMAEEQTGKSLITQRWQLLYDHCPPSLVALPYGPVQSIVSVVSVADDGEETSVASSQYHLNARRDLQFETTPSGHQVCIEYEAGFGDSASNIPSDIVQAVLLHIAHLYEHRDSMSPPLATQLIYTQHREIRL